MPSTDKCEFCGKELQPRLAHLLGQDRMIGHEPCGCADAIAKRAAQQAAQEAEAKRRAIEHRNRRYERAGIAPRYMDATTDEKHRSLYIVGKTGPGKSHFAAALAKQAVDEGSNVQMISSPDLMAKIKDTYNRYSQTTEEDIFAKYGACDVLVLDDLGKEAPTEWSLQTLYRIIDHRYTHLLETIITSQFERDKMIDRLGVCSYETAVAIMSRLFEMCERYPMAGEDRRLHA